MKPANRFGHLGLFVQWWHCVAVAAMHAEKLADQTN
jgi:hypothetical protein